MFRLLRMLFFNAITSYLFYAPTRWLVWTASSITLIGYIAIHRALFPGGTLFGSVGIACLILGAIMFLMGRAAYRAVTDFLLFVRVMKARERGGAP